jgi:pantetheine-phosphate adenylyltransferase
MEKIAIFPGSFDPITKGHEDIVLRAAGLFDRVIVAIGHNTSKKYLFPLEQRLQWINDTFRDVSNVEVQSYEGLTVDYCKSIRARYMIRGLRSVVDFEYEKAIAQMSAELDNEIETVLLYTAPQFSAINSTVVREIIKNNGDVSTFVPNKIDVYA